jgi:hypothetical protein
MPRFRFHKDAPSGQDARQSQDLATCEMSPLEIESRIALEMIAGVAHENREPADFAIAMNAIDRES